MSGWFYDEPFRRNHYFYGKLLTSRDFGNEQAYINEKRRLINACVLGSGVVFGLDVSIDKGKAALDISPGVAIDPLGWELVIREAGHYPIRELAASSGIAWAGGETYCVCISHAELKSEEALYVAGVDSPDAQTVTHGYIIDGVSVSLLPETQADKLWRLETDDICDGQPAKWDSQETGAGFYMRLAAVFRERLESVLAVEGAPEPLVCLARLVVNADGTFDKKKDDEQWLARQHVFSPSNLYDMLVKTGEALEAKTSDLEAKTSDLEAKASDLEAKTSDLEAKTSDLEAKVSDLEAETKVLAEKLEERETFTGRVYSTIELMVESGLEEGDVLHTDPVWVSDQPASLKFEFLAEFDVAHPRGLPVQPPAEGEYKITEIEYPDNPGMYIFEYKTVKPAKWINKIHLKWRVKEDVSIKQFSLTPKNARGAANQAIPIKMYVDPKSPMSGIDGGEYVWHVRDLEAAELSPISQEKALGSGTLLITANPGKPAIADSPGLPEPQAVTVTYDSAGKCFAATARRPGVFLLTASYWAGKEGASDAIKLTIAEG